MKRKIFALTVIIMMVATIFISTVSSNENLKIISNSNIEDDVPTWEENTLWTYRIDDFDLIFDETEGRSYEFHINTEDFKLKVAEDTGSLYRTEFESEIELEIIIDMDLFIEDTDPIIISLLLSGATLDGNIYFDKSTMGIVKLDANIKGIFKINSTSPINLQFLSTFPLPLNINLIIEFDEPYSLIDFPINTDKVWGLPQVNLTMDGEIKSILLRIVNIINNIAKIFGMGFIPPEFAQFLPIIDISELLTLFNITDTVGIPEIPEIFECTTQKSINVEAGSYNTYEISFQDNLANMYYSPDEGVIVKMIGNFNNFLPFLQDINIELIDVAIDNIKN